MPSTEIELSRSIYYNASAEYERYYFDEETGGFVLIHVNRSATLSEIYVSETFARQGKQVWLLEEKTTPNQKQADASINGQLWEFKELRNATNVRGATQQDIREGRKQAGNLAYHLNQDYDIDDVNRGIRSAIRFDEQKLLRRIALVFNSGATVTLTREAIENGANFPEL